MDLVSIVIPCYNCGPYVFDAIGSARAQDHPHVEIILVNDGSDSPQSLELLRRASRQVDRYVEQPNRGLAAARNAGFRSARGSYVVPLDSDDLLEKKFVSECLDAIRHHPEAGFVHTDYRVFGTEDYVERLEDYNLNRLLEENTLIYAALIGKADWELAGGYDDSEKLAYEDWEFWLRMAAHGKFGCQIHKPLFRYRKHGPSLIDVLRQHHAELAARIRANHPELYEFANRAKIKARWEPCVAVVGLSPGSKLSIADWQAVETGAGEALLENSRAPAFLFPPAGEMDPHSAEFAALAVWSGNHSVRLPDGSRAVSRGAVLSGAGEANFRSRPLPAKAVWQTSRPGPLERLNRHLTNAELVSAEAWVKHPLRSASRLVPLRLKERLNHMSGQRLFDLTFYLKFQPRALVFSDSVVRPLDYMPVPSDGRRRIALITPHLGPGGAEHVLLELAAALDRSQFEISVIATHSRDSRWLARWKNSVDHIYDLSAFVADSRLVAAVHSIAVNWAFDAILLQNSLIAYSGIPALKRALPNTRVMDLIHSVDEGWDVVTSTAAISRELDARVVISEAARQRLRQAGVDEGRIRLIRNGVDLESFQPAGRRTWNGAGRIVFAGRLDAVKRPLLLADIARVLLKRHTGDFRFIIAGDGEEEPALRGRLKDAGIAHLFDLMGYVPDLAPVFATADLVVIPSRSEGIPLVLLQALASGKPVVASNVGAIGEVLDESCGFLVDVKKGEAEEFAERIQILLEDPGLRETMGMNGRRKVEADYDRAQSQRMYRELFA